MAAEGDDDLYLVRASAGLISDIRDALPKLLWKKGRYRHVHQLVRQRDLDHIIQSIETFQGEPQLLDTSLKQFLPPIVEAYLAFLQLPNYKPPPPGSYSLDVAASKLLYIFCKVRGEKIVIGFLNNEPKYLELILTTLEGCRLSQDTDLPWEKSYVLLLWLTHLMLVPFDLSSISAVEAVSDDLDDFHLPSNLPPVACRVIALGVHYLMSATREQDAAAKMLVRLVVRPDMQRLHIATAVSSWTLDKLSSPSSPPTSNIHTFLGPLRFLVGMSVSADSEEVAGLIPSIYTTGQRLMEDSMLAFLNSSAVTKKLAVKLFRNIALLSLHSTSDRLVEFFENTSVLEETIDYCLQSLEDRDTPVRFAASKALSMTILRLDPDMGHEVVQAILDSFQDDMPRYSSETDFGSVNPLRWHGLTLTLAHALFRRSASPQQLPEILKALILALSFEQRTAVGVSTGSNVRDAACFGVWSLSRRYTTQELLSVDPSSIGLEFVQGSISIIQVVANQLLLSACLDPSGNIRRGSSAALQELIGRHPDQIRQGIPLVQIVDYHAVGLRQRAMVDVAYNASELDPIYRESLLLALQRWRGLGSPDVSSREAAGESIGRLCMNQSAGFCKEPIAALHETVVAYPKTDVEVCHGSLTALSHLIDTKVHGMSNHTKSDKEDLSYLLASWQLIEHVNPVFTTYSSRAVRVELFPAVSSFIASLAELSLLFTPPQVGLAKASENLRSIVSGLLSRSENSLLQVLPRMVRALSLLHTAKHIESPILDLEDCRRKAEVDSYGNVLHGAGRAIALGAAFPWADEVYNCNRTVICTVLANMVKSAPLTEWRVIGLQALDLITRAYTSDLPTMQMIAGALHDGLNDYTITERGDVGSLVRTQAIQCVQRIQELGQLDDQSEEARVLIADMIRLSFEKMDRVRLQAARCLSQDFASSKSASETDVSSYRYFFELVQPLHGSPPAWKREAILKGCISCAGISAESLLRASRSALADTLYQGSVEMRAECLLTFTGLLKEAIAQGIESQPLLEILAYLLESLPSVLPLDNNFNWRVLLSLVQKSHFKSNNIPRILAALNVYRSLAEVPSIREDTLKKLVSMLRTNPYPKVRVTTAECLLLATGDQSMKGGDWSKPGQKYELNVR